MIETEARGLLVERLARAVADPGAIVGRRYGPQWGEGNDGYSDVYETLPQWTTRAVVAVVADALAVTPCHITGMHEPEHHTRYLCADQEASMARELLAGLGLTVADLPRRLHPGCFCCHNVPSQEKYRERLRETHRWAGVEIPAELAEPAPDAPRPGDDQVALQHLSPQWQDWTDVFRKVETTTSWDGGRVSAVLHGLLASGAAEQAVPSWPTRIRLTTTTGAAPEADARTVTLSNSQKGPQRS